ncbi:MAG: glycosyltransferase family 2 protein [Candidatus Baldrarchaeia archaeon]
MVSKPKVSVLIPTYRRGYLIRYTLEALEKQTCKNFEVIIVLKPSGDGTEKIVKKHAKRLKINLILQHQGHVIDALNLGLKYANGDIIAFLDDDAIPDREWTQRHIEAYESPTIGGVAGNVIPARLKENKPIRVKDVASHIIPEFKTLSSFERVFRKIYCKPLPGLENHLVYISKAGVVEYNPYVSRLAWRQTVNSLLGMGANMSVLSKAVEGFSFPNSWILGLSWEQFLGWHIWKKGYSLIFDPKAIVYHLVHGETLTRNIKSAKKAVLRWVEYNLLFYRLYGSESEISKMHRIVWLIFSSIASLKKLCNDRETDQIAKLKSKFHSEIIGIKWLLSKKLGRSYSPQMDLKFFVENNCMEKHS